MVKLCVFRNFVKVFYVVIVIVIKLASLLNIQHLQIKWKLKHVLFRGCRSSTAFVCQQDS